MHMESKPLAHGDGIEPLNDSPLDLTYMRLLIHMRKTSPGCLAIGSSFIWSVKYPNGLPHIEKGAHMSKKTM